MKGTLLLAEEGINGTVSGSREGIDALFAWLRSDPRLADIEHKESLRDEQPFYRTKVKLKKENRHPRRAWRRSGTSRSASMSRRRTGMP